MAANESHDTRLTLNHRASAHWSPTPLPATECPESIATLVARARRRRRQSTSSRANCSVTSRAVWAHGASSKSRATHLSSPRTKKNRIRSSTMSYRMPTWSSRSLKAQSRGVLLTPEPAVVIDGPVPAIGTALDLDLEPTLLTVRHGRRPQRALRILRLPFDRHITCALPAILGSFVDRAERPHFSARSIGISG